MGSSGSGDQEIETTVRFPPYMEDHHQRFLLLTEASRDDIINDSPYQDDTPIDSQTAFFGTGYTISEFPSLYDMYGKFMAGLDICALHNQIMEDSVNEPAINNLIASEAALMDDDIETRTIPRFEAGMRDINAVMSSSFIGGRVLIEDTRIKTLSKFSSELKYKLVLNATDRWKTHLEWNKSVIHTYAHLLKLYFASTIDVDVRNYSIRSQDALWPFTVLDQERACLGALTGASSSTSTASKGSDKSSQLTNALGGALSGAAAGAPMGPPGMAILGVLGAATAFF